MAKTRKTSILKFIASNPDSTNTSIAQRFKVHPVTVSRIRSQARKAEGADGSSPSEVNGAPVRARTRTRIRRQARIVRGRPRSGPSDSPLVDRLREEYDALGRMIELLENRTAREVLERVTGSRVG
jgi:hypothetical protein